MRPAQGQLSFGAPCPCSRHKAVGAHCWQATLSPVKGEQCRTQLPLLWHLALPTATLHGEDGWSGPAESLLTAPMHAAQAALRWRPEIVPLPDPGVPHSPSVATPGVLNSWSKHPETASWPAAGGPFGTVPHMALQRFSNSPSCTVSHCCRWAQRWSRAARMHA